MNVLQGKEGGGEGGEIMEAHTSRHGARGYRLACSQGRVRYSVHVGRNAYMSKATK